MKEAYVSPTVDIENKAGSGLAPNVGWGVVVLVLGGLYLVAGAVAAALWGVVWVTDEDAFK